MCKNKKTIVIERTCYIKNNFTDAFVYFCKIRYFFLSLSFFLFKYSLKRNFFTNNDTFSAIWSLFSKCTGEEVASGVATTKGIMRHPHEYSKWVLHLLKQQEKTLYSLRSHNYNVYLYTSLFLRADASSCFRRPDRVISPNPFENIINFTLTQSLAFLHNVHKKILSISIGCKKCSLSRKKHIDG